MRHKTHPNTIKEIFNEKAKGGTDYDKNRWFGNAMRRAGYAMTRDTVENKITNACSSFSDYLEVGPGTGIWTQYFLKNNPSAHYNLVDISKNMLQTAKEVLSTRGNISFIEKDFLLFMPQKKYDMFFSARALEYIPNKKAAVQKIADLLTKGGNGFIVTKTPHYKRAKLLKRNLLPHHTGQIAPNDLKNLLQNAGLRVTGIYPVTLHFPLINSPRLDMFLYTLFSSHRLNAISRFFSESYYIAFTKL